jgi:hypothetical protein
MNLPQCLDRRICRQIVRDGLNNSNYVKFEGVSLNYRSRGSSTV